MTGNLPRRMAEDEITCACDALVASDALADLTEIRARSLPITILRPILQRSKAIAVC